MKQNATAVIATAILMLSAAACSSGGSPSSSTASADAGGSSSSPSAVAYAACMRSRGVPDYPDPDSNGLLAKGGAQQFGVSDSAFQAAQRACQDLLPATGGSFMQQFQQCVSGVCPQALVQEALTKQRKFAQCMRRHGIPSFPDPGIGPNGAPYFPASEAGLSHQYTHSSGFRSKEEACQGEAGGSVPVLMG
jgi:hypothetical protein